ncbi:Protein CBG11535 [Caenorhabditis briggsae]|uniref:Protein CBG11535 n=1 Tax=Caenorhabditis briggsae TaxID=6238 RepID=A8XCR8_CAEBR|nr:Protein CBG11535 [Caenorhabditis briggsae]CAP30436.2 Protein CBG11535 [Caenorhabditis briggsae]
MSVDQTITELSGTLAQLSTLVAHINGQISGITGRVNLTLDNFDQAVANLAKDAGSLTYQVGNTVSQVSNIEQISEYFIRPFTGTQCMDILLHLHHSDCCIYFTIDFNSSKCRHKSTSDLLLHERFGRQFQTNARRKNTTKYRRFWITKDANVYATRADTNGDRAKETGFSKRCEEFLKKKENCVKPIRQYQSPPKITTSDPINEGPMILENTRIINNHHRDPTRHALKYNFSFLLKKPC